MFLLTAGYVKQPCASQANGVKSCHGSVTEFDRYDQSSQGNLLTYGTTR